MGYRRQPKIYNLKFEDYPGLEVSARSVPVGELLKIIRLTDAMAAKADEKQMQELFGWFAGRLIAWNLEDEDGKPVPPTAAGLLGEEVDFVMQLITGWLGAVSGTPDPTAPANGAGPGSRMEASIPMTAATAAGT